MNKFSNKKKIILGSIIGVLLGSLVSVTYAIFSYTRTGNNQQLVTGDIYMHYKESNELTLDNAIPSSTYDPNKYFEFTVDGKNTNTKYDIIYDVTLNRGENHATRTERLADKFLKFTLMEKKTGESEWTTVVDSKSYNDLSSGIRVWVDNISKNQTTEVVHTYRLYMWIDNSVVIGNTGTPGIDYDMDTWNNQIYASVKVTVTGDFTEKEPYREPLHTIVRTHLTNDNSITDNNNVTYISGCREDAGCDAKNTIDFNYVWYSGKLWRVVSIYEDGTMKLITENPITVISWGENTAYSTSWIREWLNEDFKDTLVNQNNVLISGDENFYWNSTNKSTSQRVKDANSTTETVGLLDIYEYFWSGTKKSYYYNGYLKNDRGWWLITISNSNNVFYVLDNGNPMSNYPYGDNVGVRPSIYLKSTVKFVGGTGMRNDPYRIGEDMKAPSSNIKLNTRISGEYVTFKNELYRIVGVENNTTKIVKSDYLNINGSLAEKSFASTVYFGKIGNIENDNYWDYYLNNSWLSNEDLNLITMGTYYLGKYYDPDTGYAKISYKATICDPTNDVNYESTTKTCDKLKNTENITNIYTGYVGLLRVGEMFSSQLKTAQSSYKSMCLITPMNSSQIRTLGMYGSLSYINVDNSSCAVRPTVNLKSNVIITGGDGTEQHPFEIALGSE